MRIYGGLLWGGLYGVLGAQRSRRGDGLYLAIAVWVGRQDGVVGSDRLFVCLLILKVSTCRFTPDFGNFCECKVVCRVLYSRITFAAVVWAEAT